MNESIKQILEYLKVMECSNEKEVYRNLMGISHNLLKDVPGSDLNNKAKYLSKYLNTDNIENIEKKKLNIIIADGSSSLEYVNYLNTTFDVTVLDFKNVKKSSEVDLVLFTGGEDVNPEYYSENTGKFTFCNNNRDQKESKVYNAFAGTVPLLGICRGAQFLTVMAGGKLIQHVEGHGRDHTIMINNYSRLSMTSTHHQMMYPFDMVKNRYELIGYSEYFQSNVYLNGKNEQIEKTSDFLEAEIVYYPRSRALCIQGHPEYNHCDSKTKKVCMELIEKYLLSEKKVENNNQLDDYYEPYDAFYDAVEPLNQYAEPLKVSINEEL